LVSILLYAGQEIPPKIIEIDVDNLVRKRCVVTLSLSYGQTGWKNEVERVQSHRDFEDTDFHERYPNQYIHLDQATYDGYLDQQTEISPERKTRLPP